jgi:hypothetical protein
VDSAAVLNAVAVVGASLIAALLGIIGVLLGKILGNTNKTVEHVVNSHVDDDGNPFLLRDDLDEKFDGLAGLVKGVAETQKEQAKDIGGLRSDIRQIRTDQTADRATAGRAATAAAEAAEAAREALERTQPKPYTRRKPE